MKTLTVASIYGTSTHTADEYTGIIACLFGINHKVIIDTEARDEIIHMAYVESTVIGASNEVIFAQTDLEGQYVARLYVNTLIWLKDIGNDLHEVYYIRKETEGIRYTVLEKMMRGEDI